MQRRKFAVWLSSLMLADSNRSVARAPAPANGCSQGIAKDALRRGDVLLSRGTDAISRFICDVDHGIYSHSAVWDGTQVVEATTKGVVRRTLEQEMCEQWYVDAYRWKTRDNPLHWLGDPAYPAEPVVTQADTMADGEWQRYAYDELVMGVLVIGLSERPRELWLRVAARLVLGAADAWIHTHVFKGMRGMVCTEVACSSFWQAAPLPPPPPPPPPHGYAINIRIDGSRTARLGRAVLQRLGPPAGARAAPSESGYEHLRGECWKRFMDATVPAGIDAAALGDCLSQVVAPAGGPCVPAGCVTPREVQNSPNLTCIGRLSEQPNPPPSESLLAFLLGLLWSWVKHRFERQRTPAGA